jgi:hypothetical protein
MTGILLAVALLQPSEIRAVRESDSLIRVVSPGRFETTFTKRKGFGSTWFDLARDPGKKRDLAPVLDENGFFWIKIGKPEGDGSWYANPAEELTLLEDGPVRVRVRLRGAHMRYGNTDAKAAWKELRFDQTHTLLADGSVHIAYALEQEQAVVYKHFLVITKSNGSWGAQGKGEGKGEVRIAGESGAAKPGSKSPTSFTLQWSDGPTWFTDILMVARKGRYGAAYWNEGYLDKDIRCSFDLAGAFPDKTIPAGSQRIHFLMRFADGINSAETAAVHAKDYRSPDALAATKGSVGGFNDDEGCYVLTAAPEGVAFTLHGAAIPRVNPVFKVRGWPGAAPASILVNGKPVAQGKGMAAAVRDGVLLVQLFAVVSDDAVLTIAP